MAKRGTPPRKPVARATPKGSGFAPVPPRSGRSTPAPSLTGKLLAVLLGALFVAAVLVGAVKGFGAAHHPMLGLLVGIACLLLSGGIYLRSARKNK